MDNIVDRLIMIKEKGINNVLALKGWEQNDNYLKENQVSSNQPEYLFNSVPDWISYLKQHFTYISGTTYIEGHPFRRRKINSEKNKGKEFHAIKKEYNLSGKKCYMGILKENLIAAIKYDIQKIKSGAQKIFCAHVFNANLFIEYKKKFESFSNNTTYELIPEISVGASKRSFYNDTLLSSTYCTDDFQDTIFKYGENIFDINSHVNVIGKGKELEIISQRKNYYKAIILQKKICNDLTCYDVKFNDDTIEYNVPISRISTEEIDIVISRIWIDNCKEQVKIFIDNNISSIYIISIDMDSTIKFIEECLAENLLKKSQQLYK